MDVPVKILHELLCPLHGYHWYDGYTNVMDTLWICDCDGCPYWSYNNDNRVKLKYNGYMCLCYCRSSGWTMYIKYICTCYHSNTNQNVLYRPFDCVLYCVRLSNNLWIKFKKNFVLHVLVSLFVWVVWPRI